MTETALPMNRRPNSMQLLPSLVLVLFFAVASFSVVYGDWLERKRLISEASAQARNEAGQFARQAQYALGTASVEGLHLLAQEVMLARGEHHVSRILLLDDHAQVLYADQPDWRGLPVHELIRDWNAARFTQVRLNNVSDLKFDTQGMRVSILAPFVLPPQPGQVEIVRRGVVFIQYDLAAELDQQRLAKLTQRLPELVLVLLFAVGLAVWVQRSVVLPLRQVADASRQLSAGDLRVRVAAQGSGEMVELAEHFNVMATNLGQELAARRDLTTQLQKSYEQLVRLTAHLPGVVYQYQWNPATRHGFMLFTNSRIRDLLGLEPEALAEDATPLLDCIHPDDRPAFDESVRVSARAMSLWLLEFRLRLPDGSYRWHATTAQPERQADGSLQWYGYFMDISERRQAEEQQRLSASIFETAGEAIMLTDTSGAIIMVNPAFCRITGYERQEVLGHNPSMLSAGRHPPSFHKAVFKSLQEQDAWAGEVWNRRKNGEHYPEWQSINTVRNEQGEITHYVSVFADLSEIRRAQEEAEKLSWRDPLTGLANRALFLQQIEQTLLNARREGGYAAALVLNVDRFKNYNEARGLSFGDTLLQSVGQRLATVLGSDDVLARLNADEFAVILPQLMIRREDAGRVALAMAEKLRAVLAEAVCVETECYRLDSCVGIALLPDEAEETAVDALRRADMAMHLAKQEGGARTVFFEASMGEAIRERFQLESELHQAVTGDQLRLYLQPQMNAAGQQVGSEALVRWQHPERGLVPPAMFVPLAETTDLIVSLDRWMLRRVCELLVWLGHDGHGYKISVNVSPRHFARNDFVDEVLCILEATGADPSYLILEITEGMVIGDIDDVVAKMSRLTRLGIPFSMDDFGTGYSSLAYLKRLPIHELKIDKSFIRDSMTDPDDAALVETILSVAQHLRLQVVAEGVETQDQADFLNARAEVIHQGYFFGRPEPVDQWLARLMPSNQAG